MSDPGNISGSPVQIKMAGEMYTMSPLTDVDYGEFENWMRARVIELARENIARVPGLSQSEKDTILKQSVEISVRLNLQSQEAMPYMTSIDGAAYLMWLSLKKTHAALSHSGVKKLLIDERTLSEAFDKFDLINNIPGAKEKGGQRKRNKKIQEAVNSVIDSALGQKSTDSSQPNTDGVLPKLQL